MKKGNAAGIRRAPTSRSPASSRGAFSQGPEGAPEWGPLWASWGSTHLAPPTPGGAGNDRVTGALRLAWPAPPAHTAVCGARHPDSCCTCSLDASCRKKGTVYISFASSAPVAGPQPWMTVVGMAAAATRGWLSECQSSTTTCIKALIPWATQPHLRRWVPTRGV